MAGAFAVALISTGCDTMMYAQTDNGYNDYSYDNGYGDGTYDYSQNTYAPQDNEPQITFDDFYTQLSPYGSWVSLSPYGRVWVAGIRNFQPYSTNGYWSYTNYGWTWVSNYPWGWAPFHYGRWGYSDAYGWFWIPGYAWGPAWVAWSSNSDMYGWAPLGPGMSLNVNISIGSFPANYWTFMPGRYMGRNNISNYYVNRSRNVTIINNHTTIINNYGNMGSKGNRHYSMGPRATDVQRYTGRTIQQTKVVTVRDSKSVGVSNNELRVYRPAVRSANTSTNRRTTTPSNNVQQQNRTAPVRTQTNTNPSRAYRPVQQQTQQQRSQPARTTQPVQQRTTTTPQTRTVTPVPLNKNAAPQTRRQIREATRQSRTQTKTTTHSRGR
ncbi:hypothetical protein A9P82_01535 [Arachidicoccus ginsenosidimutans]|nr:hypothetical protein A9P82_01535 [Arachidicoccus sp. BS20]